jgi:hypothetical protein
MEGPRPRSMGRRRGHLEPERPGAELAGGGLVLGTLPVGSMTFASGARLGRSSPRWAVCEVAFAVCEGRSRRGRGVKHRLENPAGEGVLRDIWQKTRREQRGTQPAHVRVKWSKWNFGPLAR